MTNKTARQLVTASALRHGWTLEEDLTFSSRFQHPRATLAVRWLADDRVAEAVYYHKTAVSGLGQNIWPDDRNKRDLLDFLLVSVPETLPAASMRKYYPSWSMEEA